MLKLFESPLIVLGMHRSGTTMLTEILISSGYFMGKDLSSNAESYMFTKINETLLNAHGGSWHNPVEVMEAENIELNEQRFYLDFLRIRRNPFLPLKIRMFNKWGWKDPRNTFTFTYWKENYFSDAKLLHIYRNGIDVALSLKKRNSSLPVISYIAEMDDFIYNFNLWEKYVERAFKYQEDQSIRQLHISYEKLLAKDADTMSKLETFVGIENLAETINRKAVTHKSRNDAELLSDGEMARINSSEWMKKLDYGAFH